MMDIETGFKLICAVIQCVALACFLGPFPRKAPKVKVPKMWTVQR